MKATIQLNAEALKTLELPSSREDSRLYQLPNFEGAYLVEITKADHAATFTHPIEKAETPTYGECAEVIGELFRGMLAPACPDHLGWNRLRDVSEREDGPGPDFKAGWEEYRRQLRETHACLVPAWDQLPTEVQECFCAGVWETMESDFPHHLFKRFATRVVYCKFCGAGNPETGYLHLKTGLRNWFTQECRCVTEANTAKGGAR